MKKPVINFFVKIIDSIRVFRVFWVIIFSGGILHKYGEILHKNA
jgi:hypothetical protein